MFINQQSIMNARKPWNSAVLPRKEKINLQKLGWLWLNYDKIMGDDYKGWISGNVVSNNVYKKELKKYIESFEMTNFPIGIKTVEYGQGILNEGRFMSKEPLSLQTINRRFRHTICQGLLRDIDVVACHPSVMYNILRPMYNLELPALGTYLKNDKEKKDIIDELLLYNPEHTKETIKSSICAVLNGGGFKSFKKPTQWYSCYYNETQNALEKLVKALDYSNPAYREDSEKKKGRDYPFLNGSIVNHLLVDYENRIAFHMRNVLEERRFKVVALTHDGCMVEEDEGLDDKVLRDIEEVLEKNDLNGIKLKYKDMDEFFEINEKELEAIDKDNIVFEKTINYDDEDVIYKLLQEGDSGMSKLFVNKIKDDIKIVDGNHIGFCWNPRTRLWDGFHNKAFFANRITDILIPMVNPILKSLEDKNLDGACKQVIKEHKDKIKYWKKIISYIQSSNGCNCIWDKAKTQLYDKEFTQYLNKKTDEYPTRGGYKVNLRTKKVSLRNRQDYWDYESPASYIEGDTPDKRRMFKFLKQVCVEEGPNGEDMGIPDEKAEQTIFLWKKMGYYLTAETSDRKIDLFYGKGQNSKSVIMEMLGAIMVMDKGFSTLSRNALLKKDERRSGATPELMPFKHCRFVVLIETDKKPQLDSSLIKSITGNDTIRIRDLHKTEENCKSIAKTSVVSNYKAEIDTEDKALLDRINFIPFRARFEKTPENTTKVQNMIQNDKDPFFSLMVDYGAEWWEDKNLELPTVCKEATQQLIEENNDIDPWIQQHIKLDTTDEEVNKHKQDNNNNNFKGVYEGEAFKNYLMWCDKEEKPSRGKKEWRASLESRNIEIKDNKGRKVLKYGNKFPLLIKVEAVSMY